MRGDVTQEAERPRFIAAFTAAANERHGAVGAGAGVLDLIREQIRLAEVRHAQRMVKPNPCGFVSGQSLLQAREALADVSRQRVDVPQGRHGDRSVTRDVHLASSSSGMAAVPARSPVTPVKYA